MKASRTDRRAKLDLQRATALTGDGPHDLKIARYVSQLKN